MVGPRHDAVLAQKLSELLGPFARADIDDAVGPSLERLLVATELHQRAKLGLVVLDRLRLQVQVGSENAGAHEAQIAPESLPQLVLHGWRRRGGHRQHARLPEQL